MKLYKYSDFNELEQTVNKELNLSSTQGSGSLKGNGDGIGRNSDIPTYIQLLNDSKFTDKEAKSLSLKLSDWKKTEEAAKRYGRIPIMTTGDQSKRIFVTMDLSDFCYIYEMALESIKGNSNEKDSV